MAAIFVTIEDGADPTMKKVIGAKATEGKQIINPEGEVLAATEDTEKILPLAKDYLKRQGEDVDTILKTSQAEKKDELFIPPPTKDQPAYEVWSLISRRSFNPNNEEKMQTEIAATLKGAKIRFEHEAWLSNKSRVDFKVGDILIECKEKGFNKKDLLRQVRRYLKDAQKTKAIIVVTSDKLNHFQIKETPVYTVNVSDNSLLIGVN